jgi:hypothetical protein
MKIKNNFELKFGGVFPGNTICKKQVQEFLPRTFDLR